MPLKPVTRAVLCADWPGYTRRCHERPIDEVLRDRDVWLGIVEGHCRVRGGEPIEEVADTLWASFGRWEDAIGAAEDLLANMRHEVKVGVVWGPLYLVGEEQKAEGPVMCTAATLAEEWAHAGEAMACVPECPAGWCEHRLWPYGAVMVYRMEIG